MSYVPGWIFEAAVTNACREFLAADLPMNAICKKYAQGLSERYSEIRLEEFSIGIESLTRFLAEVDAGEAAVDFLNGFVFYRIHYETKSKPRKLKPLFGSVEDPVKTLEYSTEETLKKFKAYVFGLRSNAVPLAPAGWQLDDEHDLVFLNELAGRSVDFLDGF